jgi:transposase InsO family protein
VTLRLEAVVKQLAKGPLQLADLVTRGGALADAKPAVDVDIDGVRASLGYDDDWWPQGLQYPTPERQETLLDAHAIVDDHSRLAYVELHSDERAQTVTAFLERALAFFASHGIEARRLMTDNAFAYVRNRSLRELLEARRIKHLTTQAYRPRTNGKVERFHQTMAREWAYGMAYRSHRHRNRALPHWLRYYNQRRPHSGIGDRPPISRVHDLLGQDS